MTSSGNGGNGDQAVNWRRSKDAKSILVYKICSCGPGSGINIDAIAMFVY